MPPKRHPNKDIRKAIEEATGQGWIVEVSKGRSARRWGCIRCGSRQCKVTINSTPREPETYAKRIRKAVAKCPHQTKS
jgi:hypothetical protein